MKKIVNNASWIVGVQIIKSVLGLFISMLTSRYLGPSNYGVISYASSLVNFVVPIMNLGITNILVQEIVDTSDDSGKILGTSIILNLISGLCCIVGIVSFVCIANKGETETIIVCVLYSAMLLFQGIGIIQYWFQAKLLSKYPSVISFLVHILIMLYKIFLLVFKKSIYWFVITYVLEQAIVSFFLIIFYKNKSSQKLSFSFSLAKRLFNKSKYYIVSSMMVTIFAQTDTIMIKIMLGNSEVGFYSAAVMCASLTSFVFGAIIDSFRPVVFEKKQISNQEFEKVLSCLYSVVMYLSLFQCVGITLFSKIIIGIIYGKDYLPAVSALRIIVWYTTFAYLGSLRNIWILAKEQQRHLWKINLSGALLNVGLNTVLIPVCGINGAAIASLITQVFTNVFMPFCIKDVRESNKFIFKGLNFKNIFYYIKRRDNV